MAFFDSLTDLIGWTNSNAQDHADSGRLNLGNIFLPGGMSGGAINETPGGGSGFGGSPLNQKDWEGLNSQWGTVRSAANYDDINWDSIGGNPLSTEAQGFLKNNWNTIRPAAALGDINWKDPRVVGTPGYAATPGAAPGTPGAPGAAPGSTLGDLEPARAGLAGVAGGAPVGENTQGNILELLRQQAQPYEQQAQNRLNNNLFSRGRLGGNDSATGEAYRGFSRGLAEADTGRQLSAYGLSDQLQTSQLGRQLGAAQGAAGLTQLSTLPFDMALKLAAARSGSALGQSNSAAYQNDNIMDSWGKFWGGLGGGR